MTTAHRGTWSSCVSCVSSIANMSGEIQPHPSELHHHSSVPRNHAAWLYLVPYDYAQAFTTPPTSYRIMMILSVCVCSQLCEFPEDMAAVPHDLWCHRHRHTRLQTGPQWLTCLPQRGDTPHTDHQGALQGKNTHVRAHTTVSLWGGGCVCVHITFRGFHWDITVREHSCVPSMCTRTHTQGVNKALLLY